MIIGEQSEPSEGRWMENFVFPRMPVCLRRAVCVCARASAVLSYPGSARMILPTGIKKGNGRLGKRTIQDPGLDSDENDC